MRIERPLVEGEFVLRENRFRARVYLDGQEVCAFIPNSGRLTELLVPGRHVYLGGVDRPGRVTKYDLLMVRMPHLLVSIDARLPNEVLYEALEARALPEFAAYSAVRREVSYGNSRLDFLLEAADGARPCLIEAKSVTLVRNGIGYFPDAVTERGRRHLLELRRAASDGMRAAAVFVVQRRDVEALAPHDESDPVFGNAMRRVAAEGVELYAYSCTVSLEEVVLNRRVPVILARGAWSVVTEPSGTSRGVCNCCDKVSLGQDRSR